MRRITWEEQPPRSSQKRISVLEAHLLSIISGRRQADPRQLSLSMKRELDWIAMKALEKEHSRRYEAPACYKHTGPH